MAGPRWLPGVLSEIRRCVEAERVRFTYKALRELSSLGLHPDDAIEVLRALVPGDAFCRLASEVTEEWMYVFKPTVGVVVVYLKVILRDGCVVVSFHEDDDDEDA
jgi:hypothetical protein